MGSEHSRTDPDAWIGKIYGLRWYFRYPIAALFVAIGCWMYLQLNSGARSEWVAIVVGGIFFLWGLSYAWELTLAIIAGLAVWWFTTWSRQAQQVLMVAALFAWSIYLQEQSTKRLQRQIDQLQKQTDQLRDYLDRIQFRL